MEGLPGLLLGFQEWQLRTAGGELKKGAGPWF
jgi:hypothetical protein